MDKTRKLYGSNCHFDEGSIVGYVYSAPCGDARIGSNARVRSGSVIYCDVTLGDYFQAGHNVLIREHTVIGNHVTVGTNTVIDGNVKIGDFVKIESNCYIPTHVRIGCRVFLGPNVVLTNDKYPLKLRDEYQPDGPVIGDGVTLGAGTIVLPGIKIGADSMVAAGALVTKDVPPMSLVTGVPGTIRKLPAKLRERNMALSWKRYINE